MNEKVKVYTFRYNNMKKLVNMILIVVFLVGLGAYLQGCMFFRGHGRDADPFIEGETQLQNWDDFFAPEDEPSPAIQSRSASHDVADDSLLIISRMINDVGFQISEVALTQIKTSQSIKTIDRNPPAYTYGNVSLSRNGVRGGRVQVMGEYLIVRETHYRCAIVADLFVNYSSYIMNNFTKISGTYDARIIMTSRSCDYHKNMHLDFKMMGNLDVNNVTLEEMEYTADYLSTGGGDLILSSSLVDTADDYRYCYHGPYDVTECVSSDVRPFEDFCSYDDDRCLVGASGDARCADDSPTGEEGHCNLGCCSPLPPETNTCNGAWTDRRECDPEIDTFFTATTEFASVVYDYETHLVCTPDGLWSPPCIPGSANNVCPFGSRCVAADNLDWGTGLEGYGYCSCTGE